jgi:hypothetical protein
LAFGVWRLAFGVWRLAFGVWRGTLLALRPLSPLRPLKPRRLTLSPSPFRLKLRIAILF